MLHVIICNSDLSYLPKKCLTFPLVGEEVGPWRDGKHLPLKATGRGFKFGNQSLLKKLGG